MKKGKVIGLLLMSATLLTGCVDSMPQLTAEQSGMIAEYAAGLLLKYSPNYDYKIVSEEELAAAEIPEQIETEIQEETETVHTQVEDKLTETEDSQVDETEIEVAVSAEDIDFASYLGIKDTMLKYQSFEICSSYPHDNDGFSVDAAQNKKLLVVHFDLENTTQQDIECDIFKDNLSIKFNINNQISTNALSTMLVDELASYMDTLSVAEIVDVVAVAEIDDISEEEIESLTVQMVSANGSCTAELLQ